jgi:hypothetical protein
MAVPAPYTFENLKDSILRYLKLKDDTEADTLASDAIRSGLVRLAAYPLKTFLATSDITTVAGQNTVSVPADFNVGLSVHLLDTSDHRDGRVFQRREEDFDQLLSEEQAVSGVPEVYTFRGGSTVLEFDRSFTTAQQAVNPKVRLRYFKRVDNLVTSTATFSISPEVEEFLIWHGRKQLASIYDAKMYPLAMQEANRALLDLIRRDTVRYEMDWV